MDEVRDGVQVVFLTIIKKIVKPINLKLRKDAINFLLP